MSNQMTYETALQELNSILKMLESGEITLDDVSVKVKRASELLEFCQQKLRAIENEIDNNLNNAD